MMIPKISMVCSVFVLAGFSFVASIYSGGAKMKQTPKVIKRQRDPKDYVQTCYKWIIFRGLGTPWELAVCLNKKVTSSNQKNLIFVLWWIEGDRGGRFLAVDSLTVEGDKLSFQFTHPTKIGTLKDLKATLPHQKTQLKSQLTNLNGKPLQDICQLQGSNLSCDNNKYTWKTDLVTWYF